MLFLGLGETFLEKAFVNITEGKTLYIASGIYIPTETPYYRFMKKKFHDQIGYKFNIVTKYSCLEEPYLTILSGLPPDIQAFIDFRVLLQLELFIAFGGSSFAHLLRYYRDFMEKPSILSFYDTFFDLIHIPEELNTTAQYIYEVRSKYEEENPANSTVCDLAFASTER